jgi:hypothetical protein
MTSAHILQDYPTHKALRRDIWPDGTTVQDQCPYGTGPMTPAYILQDCPTHKALRTDIWPDGTTLHS